ncbi:MAG: hypothetical protein AB1626_05735 [Candidatus Micrarchaeota archaeon]
MPRTTGSKLLDLLLQKGASRFEVASSHILEDHGIAAYFDNAVGIPALAFQLRKQGYHAVDLSTLSKPRLDVFSLEKESATGSQREIARALYVHMQEKGVNPTKHAWRHESHNPTVKGTWGAKEWKRIERLRRRE